MFARISTVFECTEDEFWDEIIKPKSLQFVSSPILGFKPHIEGELDQDWVVGKTYELKLYFLSILPLGNHKIMLTDINKSSNIIVSNESGLLAPVWNHTIRFKQIEDNRLHYTDEIEIKAGLLTITIWAFAHWFYRHRQRRWKILIKNKSRS